MPQKYILKKVPQLGCHFLNDQQPLIGPYYLLASSLTTTYWSFREWHTSCLFKMCLVSLKHYVRKIIFTVIAIFTECLCYKCFTKIVSDKNKPIDSWTRPSRVNTPPINQSAYPPAKDSISTIIITLFLETNNRSKP